jgi:PAS domain S-box-containing protein
MNRMASDRERENRVLILVPTAKDAAVSNGILGRAGCAVATCQDIGELCAEISLGAGAVLVTDESLKSEESLVVLSAAIDCQPEWSDLPLVLLASGGADSPVAVRALHSLHNVLVLDRPVHLPTLVSAVTTALRSRERQYEIRDHLHQREQAAEELRLAVDRYERQVRLFDGVASTTPDFVYLFDVQGRFVYANRRLLEVWGMTLDEVVGKTCRELGYEPWHHDLHMREIAQVVETKLPIKAEVPFKAPRTGIFGIYEYIFTPVIGPDGEVELVAGTTRDVTERKRAEMERENMIDFLKLVGEGKSTREIARSAVELFSRLSGCEAVGVRLEKDGDFPYYEARGFSAEFLAREDSVRAHDVEGHDVQGESGQPLLDCMCGDIICGRFDAAQPFFSHGGSFWTNSTSELLAATATEGRFARTRNHCNAVGYESLALVPLHVGDNRIGLVHFADRRRDMFTADAVSLWERLANAFAVAVGKSLAEEALRASEERMQMALEVSQSFAFEWEVGTDRVLRSDGCGVVLGISDDEERHDTSQRYFQRLHGDDRDGFMRIVEALKPSADTYHTEYRVTRGDGSTVVLKESARGLFDDAGNLCRVVGVTTDVTEQKRAEEALRESERRFREVLEGSLDAAYRRDLRTDLYDYLSPVVKQVFAVELEAMRAMSVTDLLHRIHPDDRDSVRRIIDESLLTGSGRIEYRFRGDDGHYRWLADHFTVQKSESGEPLSRSGIVRDVTELRSAQDALQEDDRRKDEFLAMLGHELRNPLAAITTGLRLLRSPNAEQHEWVKESLERQTRQMVALVDDLLDIARITRGKIQLRSEIVDLRPIAESAAESTADLMAEKRHAFVVTGFEGPLRVLGDPTRLQQIIANLLNNAAKYTNDGGRIELTLARVGDEAVVQVRDNGMGIPDDMQESIFELFGQIDSAIHRPQQGLGIGLNLVKKLVELHDGLVSVVSEGADKGSQFTVRLPIVEWAEGAEGESRPPEGAGEERLDILVVEDNPDTARMLGAVLQEKGHDVRLAENGLRAIQMATQRQPDLVVLDIGLPDISGYEVAEALRRVLGHGRTLIVAATGYGQENDRQQSRQAGVDHHLVKPVEYETLALLTREWRRTARQRQPEVEPAQLTAGATTGRARPAKVLVIDDTRAIARITQRMLQDRGHETEIAFDGPSGIEVAKRFRPEVVLCDLNLPGASGFDVLKALRDEPALNGVLVAAMTGYDDDEHKGRTKTAGFNAHLVKPVSLEQLDQLIRQLPS